MPEEEQDLGLSDEQAENELIEKLNELRSRVGSGSNLRVLLSTLVAEVEQHRARSTDDHR
jgi:hypothetical protein